MDTLTIYNAALAATCVGAAARCVLVVLGWGRRLLYRRTDLKVVRFGAVEALNLPEPLLLGVAAVILWGVPSRAQVGLVELVAAFAGAVVVVAGWTCILAVLATWPGMFAGHAIPKEHRLLTNGILGVVRHPAYAGAILIWAGLAIAHLSPLVGALTLAYVLPCYLLYIRSEEEMMQREFGRAYDAYRRNVPMLLPRMWRGRGELGPGDDGGRTTEGAEEAPAEATDS